MTKVYIRPLQLEDAFISFKWRNDPEIWEFTGSRPDITVTPEIEKDWLLGVLGKSDQKRFAICLDRDNEYIGNIQLTDIHHNRAQLHIFIGEKKYWGLGIASLATRLIVEYGFKTLRLREIYLFVHRDNNAAIRLYNKCGFSFYCGKENQICFKLKYDKFSENTGFDIHDDLQS